MHSFGEPIDRYSTCPPHGPTLLRRRRLVPRLEAGRIDLDQIVYTHDMAKHLIDIDEEALSAAQAELRTPTMKDTVNEALRQASVQRSRRVELALDRLGMHDAESRENAWR